MELQGMILFSGDLLTNGDEAAQAKFLKKYYKTYDEIKSTTLCRQYEVALANIRKNGKTQVNWEKSTELLKGMNGIKGTGYAAVLRWIITTFDDDDIKNSITTSVCKELLVFAEETCDWRKGQYERSVQLGKADVGHRKALKMWKDVRNKLKEVRNEVGKHQFYLSEYNNLCKNF